MTHILGNLSVTAVTMILQDLSVSGDDQKNWAENIIIITFVYSILYCNSPLRESSVLCC